MKIRKTNISIIKPVCAIEFKSVPAMYERECQGLKSNTLRVLNETEYNEYKSVQPEYIRINKRGCDQYFIRKIADVIECYVSLVAGDHVVLFSWG